jgi:hypothetical protein
MQTNLLGRCTRGYTTGTIIGVYLDRGEVFIIVETPDGMLQACNITSVTLTPE